MGSQNISKFANIEIVKYPNSKISKFANISVYSSICVFEASEVFFSFEERSGNLNENHFQAVRSSHLFPNVREVSCIEVLLNIIDMLHCNNGRFSQCLIHHLAESVSTLPTCPGNGE